MLKYWHITVFTNKNTPNSFLYFIDFFNIIVYQIIGRCFQITFQITDSYKLDTVIKMYFFFLICEPL